MENIGKLPSVALGKIVRGVSFLRLQQLSFVARGWRDLWMCSSSVTLEYPGGGLDTVEQI